LEHAGGLPDALSFAESRVPEPPDLDVRLRFVAELLTSLSGFLLGQPDSADLRKGEDAGGHDVISHFTAAPQNIVGRRFPLRRGAVRQHRLLSTIVTCVPSPL